MLKRFKLQIFFVLLAIITSIYFIEAPGANTIDTSTPEDTVLGFASALVDGDVDKTLMYLAFSEDPDSSYYKNVNYLRSKSKEELFRFGSLIKNGAIGKRTDSYAEWDVQIDFNGRVVKSPVIVLRSPEGWRVSEF